MTTKLKIFFNSASFTAFILSEGKRVFWCVGVCVCVNGYVRVAVCVCEREGEREVEKSFNPC